MKPQKRIEVWYTLPNGRREAQRATSLNQTNNSAKNICKRLTKNGNTGITVDVTQYDEYGDIVEGKSAWYSYDNGKLTRI